MTPEKRLAVLEQARQILDEVDKRIAGRYWQPPPLESYTKRPESEGLTDPTNKRIRE